MEMQAWLYGDDQNSPSAGIAEGCGDVGCVEAFLWESEPMGGFEIPGRQIRAEPFPGQGRGLRQRDLLRAQLGEIRLNTSGARIL